jgi:hypothetical protein
MCEKLLFNKYFLYCQVGVGEDGEIHQITVSVLILFIFFEILTFVIFSYTYNTISGLIFSDKICHLRHE